MVAVPDGLEDRVGEAEDHDVLDRLFAQVMIDSIDLRLVEPFRNDVVELGGTAQVASERLLDDEPGPRLALGIVLAGQTRGAEVLDDGFIEERRDGQVEQVTAGDVMLRAQLLQPALDTFVRVGVVVVAAEIVELLEQSGQLCGGDAAGALLDRVGGNLAELFVGILGSADSPAGRTARSADSAGGSRRCSAAVFFAPGRRRRRRRPWPWAERPIRHRSCPMRPATEVSLALPYQTS